MLEKKKDKVKVTMKYKWHSGHKCYYPSLIDDGKTLPHISITKPPVYVKGDPEYDFYYSESLEKAMEMVNFIKQCIKSDAVG